MGRHLVLMGQTFLNFKPIFACVMSSLSYVTQNPFFLSLPTWLWVTRLGTRRESAQSDVFLAPAFSFFVGSDVLCVLHCLCSTDFVEIGTFPKLYCMFLSLPQVSTR